MRAMGVPKQAPVAAVVRGKRSSAAVAHKVKLTKPLGNVRQKPNASKVKSWPVRRQLPDLSALNTDGLAEQRLPTPEETRRELRDALDKFEASEAGLARLAGANLHLFQKFMRETSDQVGSDSQAAYQAAAKLAAKLSMVLGRTKKTTNTNQPLAATPRLRKLHWSVNAAMKKKLCFKRGEIGIFSRVAVPSDNDPKVPVKARVIDIHGEKLHVVTEGSYKSLQPNRDETFLIDESNLGTATNVSADAPKDFGFLITP